MGIFIAAGLPYPPQSVIVRSLKDLNKFQKVESRLHGSPNTGPASPTVAEGMSVRSQNLLPQIFLSSSLSLSSMFPAPIRKSGDVIIVPLDKQLLPWPPLPGAPV